MHVSASKKVFGILLRALTFSVIWWFLNDGDPKSWWIGAPAVFVATWLSQRLKDLPLPVIRWRSLAPLLFYFLYKSFTSGLDVALRVVRPRLRVSPGVVPFTTTLGEGAPRNIFVIMISLLPGTLSSGLESDCIYIHSLDTSEGMEEGLRNLEGRVAGLFASNERSEAR